MLSRDLPLPPNDQHRPGKERGEEKANRQRRRDVGPARNAYCVRKASEPKPNVDRSTSDAPIVWSRRSICPQRPPTRVAAQMERIVPRRVQQNNIRRRHPSGRRHRRCPRRSLRPQSRQLSAGDHYDDVHVAIIHSSTRSPTFWPILIGRRCSLTRPRLASRARFGNAQRLGRHSGRMQRPGPARVR